MASMPLAGRAAVRWGSRAPARLLLGLLGVGVAVPALAPSLPALCVATLLFGAANGALDVTMNAQGIAVERRVGRPVLSSFHAAFSFGGLAGAALGALAAGLTFDARVHLALVGALLVVLGTAVTAGLLAASADAQAGQPAVRTAGRLRGLAVLGLAGFMCLLCEGAALDWSAIYVDRDLAGSPAVAALAYAAFSVTMAVGRLTGDRLTERLGPVAIVRVGALVAGLGLATAILVARPSAALVGFACLGAGLAVVVPIVFRAAGELPGGEPGSGIAAVSTAGYAGFLAGPPLIGAVAELTGLPVALAMLPLLCVLLAGLSSATAPRRRSGARLRGRNTGIVQG